MADGTNSNHPWRKTVFIDPIISTRSRTFTEYLETLPPEERRKIEASERAFLAKSNLACSPQQSAARDHAECQLGMKEETADLRGFG